MIHPRNIQLSITLRRLTTPPNITPLQANILLSKARPLSIQSPATESWVRRSAKSLHVMDMVEKVSQEPLLQRQPLAELQLCRMHMRRMLSLKVKTLARLLMVNNRGLHRRR
jgi:hypothetical protein